MKTRKSLRRVEFKLQFRRKAKKLLYQGEFGIWIVDELVAVNEVKSIQRKAVQKWHQLSRIIAKLRVLM